MTTITLQGAYGTYGTPGVDADIHPYPTYVPATAGGDATSNGESVSYWLDYGATYGAFSVTEGELLLDVDGGDGGGGGYGGKGGNTGGPTYYYPGADGGDGTDAGSAEAYLTNIDFTGVIPVHASEAKFEVYTFATGGRGGYGGSGGKGDPWGLDGNGADGGAALAVLNDVNFTITSGKIVRLSASANGGEGGDSSLAGYKDRQGGHGADAVSILSEVRIDMSATGDAINWLSLSSYARGGEGGESGSGYTGGNAGDAVAYLQDNTVLMGGGDDLASLTVGIMRGLGGVGGTAGQNGTVTASITNNVFDLGEGADGLAMELSGASSQPGSDRTLSLTFTGNTLRGGLGVDVLNLGRYVHDYSWSIDFALNDVTGFERVEGSGAIEYIYGDGGDTWFFGKAGNDVFDGRGGRDTAQYQGDFTFYTVTTTPGGTTYVTDSTGTRDGADMLRNVEYLRFTDGLYEVATGTFRESVGNTAPALTGAPAALASTRKDTAVVITAETLLTGFSDVDDDPIDLMQLTADHARVVNNGDGTYTLTPDAGYTGRVKLDYYVVDNRGGKVFAQTAFSVYATGLITGTGADDTLIGTMYDDTLNGLVGSDSLVGLAGNDSLNGGSRWDTLVGGDGNDTLDGWTENDAMYGGAGDDLYYVDHVGDRTYEQRLQGNDSVISSIDWALSAEVENLTLIGGALRGTGNGLSNVIIGNDGANTLSGGASADTLDGGAGSDSLDGGIGNDYLDGGLRWDTLIGGDGNDTLNGGRDNDQMYGGLGDDVYYVDHVGDRVNESTGANEGFDTVYSTISWNMTANVEMVVFTGSGHASSTGNSLHNTMTGNAGNNTLSGGTGHDTIFGNEGNDLLDGGIDSDQLNGGSGNDTLVGGQRWDTLTGGEGDDILNGGTENDRMIGGVGNDSYFVDHVGDRVIEWTGEGTDTVYSTIDWAMVADVENLVLQGTAVSGTGNGLANRISGTSGANSLSGGHGNDTITGGAGDDTLTGGTGRDDFVFGAPAGNGADQITDFVHGIDRLVFKGSDYGFAAGHVLTNAQFSVSGSAVGTGAQFGWNAATGHLWWDADGTGIGSLVDLGWFDGAPGVTKEDLYFTA